MAFRGILEPVRNPSIGEKLAKSMQTLVPEATSELARMQTQKKEDETLDRLSPGIGGIKDPELRKIALQESLKSQRASQQQQQKNQEKSVEEEGFKNSLDWLDQNVEYTGPLAKFTKFAGIPGTEAFQKRQEFDAQGFWVTDKAFTHFNKGQISKEKLKVIQQDLAPKSGLTRRTNKARIAAIRRLSGLPSDISTKALDKRVDIEKKALGKIEKSDGDAKKTERPPLSSFYE